MSKKGKILVGALILIGVILVELSMYVVPFMEEIRTFELQLFIVGVVLLLGVVVSLNKGNNKEGNKMDESFSKSFGEV